MAYYTPTNGGQILVPSPQYPSPQYVNHGPYHTPTVFHERPLPLPGKYAATFNKTSAICLGSLLICCGAAAMAGSALAFKYYAALSDIGAGLWCGAMFVATGSVAIAAGCHLSDTLISAATATSAFTVIFAIALTTMSSVGLSQDLAYYDCYRLCGSSYNCPCYYDNWEDFAIAANAVMIGAGAAAFILSVWLFVICCIALCRTPTAQVIPVQYVPNTTQTMTTTMIPNQQMHSIPVQYVQLTAAPPSYPPTILHQTVPLTPDRRKPEKSEKHHDSDHD